MAKTYLQEKITVNGILKGDGAGGISSATSSDIPNLDASKITSGTIDSARLPTANSSSKGAVKPVTKTTEMTQSVGVDANGALYTKPSSGGGGTTTNALSFLAANGTALDSFNGSAAKFLKAGDNITMTTADGVTTIAASGGGGGGGGSGFTISFSATFSKLDGAVGNYPQNNICFIKNDGTYLIYNFGYDDVISALRGTSISNVVQIVNCMGNSTTIGRPATIGDFYRYFSASKGALNFYIYLSPALDVLENYSFTYYTVPFDLTLTGFGGTSCLAPKTHISTSTSQVFLRDLRVGDKILSLDPDGNICEDTVTYCDSTEPAKYGDETDIWYFDDGTKLETVHPHEFFSADEQKFKYIADFRIGERIVKADGTKPTLVKHEVIVGKARHMTLFTEKYNTYFANGVLTGNRNSIKFTKEI